MVCAGGSSVCVLVREESGMRVVSGFGIGWGLNCGGIFD